MSPAPSCFYTPYAYTHFPLKYLVSWVQILWVLSSEDVMSQLLFELNNANSVISHWSAWLHFCLSTVMHSEAEGLYQRAAFSLTGFAFSFLKNSAYWILNVISEVWPLLEHGLGSAELDLWPGLWCGETVHHDMPQLPAGWFVGILLQGKWLAALIECQEHSRHSKKITFTRIVIIILYFICI